MDVRMIGRLEHCHLTLFFVFSIVASQRPRVYGTELVPVDRVVRIVVSLPFSPTCVLLSLVPTR